METVNLLGIEFDDLDMLDAVRALLSRPRGARFAYVVTPNADHLARLQRQPALRPLYDAAWMRLLDSQFLRHAARGLHLRAPQVATGADITAALLATLAPQPVAVIGMEQPHLAALQARYPRLTFIHHNPPADLLNNQMAFRRARDFAARENTRFTFIALGSPLQELLAYAIALQPNTTGTGLCIGTALNYCAGAARRAPDWMRRTGLEWLHRLLRNPGRLASRYLVNDPPVLLALLGEWFRKTRRRSPPVRRPRSTPGLISTRDPYSPPRPARLHEISDAG